MNHVWQVAPGVRSRVPGDRAGADGEVDVASGKYPPAVVSSGRGSRATRRQVGDCSVVPGVGAWIVAVSLVWKRVAARAINVVAQGHCHEAVICNRVVRSHRPRVCGNVVNLDMKIGADCAARDAIDFAVEISAGMEVGRDSIGWQARVVRIADRIVTPKGGCGVKVLVHAAKQVDIGAVGCAAEPATRCRKGGDRHPRIGRGAVLIRGCDSGVVDDTAETIDVAAY